MKNINEIPATCPHCGHEHPATLDACPACGTKVGSVESASDEWSAWARGRDTLKTKWVASVMAFWVSASILAVVFVIEHKINLILVSITLGMLLIGMWLKTRYQLHMRQEPSRHSSDVQAH